MSTRAQQAEAIRDPLVLDQLAGALIAAAWNVINEAATVADHTNRVKYANAIFVNPGLQASFMAPGLMSNATLSTAAGGAAVASGTAFNDSDIDFVVASLFNFYADSYVRQLNQSPILSLSSS